MKFRSRRFRFGILSAVSLIGCGFPRGTDDSVRSEAFSARDGHLRLVATGSRDTVTARDSLEVIYLIINGPDTRKFNNDPELFRIRIEDSQGIPVEPFVSSAVNRSSGQQVILTLPSNAILGQRVNLACIGTPYTTARLCEYGFKLDEPGRYRIIVRYEMVPPADSLPVIPMEALLLADTVYVTVVN